MNIKHLINLYNKINVYILLLDYHRRQESHTCGQQRSLGIQIHVRSPLGIDTMAAVCTCGLGPNINIKALFGRKSAGLKQRQKYHGCHWEFRNSDKVSEHRGGRFEQEK